MRPGGVPALVAAGVLSAGGCAYPTTPAGSGEPSGHVRQELLRLARRTARFNGARLVNAQVVRSHRDTAVRTLSGDQVSENEPVWVLQLEGSRAFSCPCDTPPGVPAILDLRFASDAWQVIRATV